MHSNALKALAFASTIIMSGTANASTLYTQPYDGSGQLQASQNDTGGGNGNFATVYDNFTLAGASTVTGLTFTGGYFNPPSPGPIAQFAVSFYANNAGQPGAAISTFTIPGNGAESCDQSAICTYSLALNFAAAGSTQYWMSIVPDLSFPPQWGWARGTGGDNASFQDFFGTRSPQAFDMAFTLTGDSGVPEPATWTMIILGMGFVGGTMRSRRRNVSVAFG